MGVFAKAALLLGCALAAASSGSVLAAPAGGDAAADGVRGDPRLNKVLTVDRRRAYLGELMDRVSAETGVRLRVSDRRGPASGYEVSAFARGRKASDVLQAVATLYDAPPDRWNWQRVAKTDPPEYELQHTLPAETLREGRTKDAQRALRQHYELLQRLYSTPPAERGGLIQRYPLLAGANDPRAQGAFSLLQNLGPENLERVIGGGRVEVPVSQLSPGARQFAQEYFEQSMSGGAFPQVISFEYVSKFGPSIVFQVGSAGGGAALGGAALERWMRTRDETQWSPDLSQVPSQNLAPTPDRGAPGRTSGDAALRQLSKATAIDVLFDHARAVDSLTANYATPLYGDLRSILEAFGNAGLLCKWRNRFALFRERGWPMANRSAAVPWPLRKSLRETAAAHGGYLRLEEWLDLAQLTRDQLDTLSPEFPDAGPIKQLQIPLRIAAGMSKREREKLSEPLGSGWDDWSPATRQRVTALFTPTEARQARILLKPVTVEKVRGIAIYFGEDGEVRPRTLMHRPWRKPPEE